MSDAAKRVLGSPGCSRETLQGLGEKIVAAIIDDISDRQGLANEWDAIDFATKEEIVDAWLDSIEWELKKL